MTKVRISSNVTDHFKFSVTGTDGEAKADKSYTNRSRTGARSALFTRLLRLLMRQGYLIEEQGMTYLAEADADKALSPLQAASCTYRIALGPRTGQKVLSLRSAPSTGKQRPEVLCANLHGFSLHAGVRCGAEQRQQLEHLCRYITRPEIAKRTPEA